MLRKHLATALMRWAMLFTAMAPMPAALAADATVIADGQHDFDFNLGDWKVRAKYRHEAPDGTVTWTDITGTAKVTKIWDGKAQLEEINADGGSSHFQVVVLFLYNPQTHEWNKSLAASSDGQLGTPMFGGSKTAWRRFTIRSSITAKPL